MVNNAEPTLRAHVIIVINDDGGGETKGNSKFCTIKVNYQIHLQRQIGRECDEIDMAGLPTSRQQDPINRLQSNASRSALWRIGETDHIFSDLFILATSKQTLQKRSQLDAQFKSNLNQHQPICKQIETSAESTL